MTKSSVNRTIRRLLDCLEETGLLAELELSDEDIADTLWLASHLTIVETENPQPEPDKSSQPESGQSKTETTETQDNKTETQVNDESDENRVVDVVTSDSPASEKETSPETEGLPFQVPAAPAIPNKLQICRALRPLMRKVPSLTKRIIDEEATVTRIAERDIWLPVTKPKPERWLDLELIVEENSGSFIWQETINELQKLLEIHGAFRNVRVWNLSSEDAKLTRRRKDGKTNKRSHRYGELIHSDHRGLILFVSDCLSSLWQQGKIHKWLKKWSRYQPTAIMQLFPERLWLNTELGLGYKLKFKSLAPVVSNSQLICESPDEDLTESSTLNIPVVTLEAEYLKYWAKVIAGYGKSQTPGIVFDLEFVSKPAKQATESAAAATQKEESKLAEAEAEIVVDRFLATASFSAQLLAGYMAAAPVDLPVVHLIQKNFLPKSTPVNVAEVFFSGMIENKNRGKADATPKYDFVPEARKLLNLAMRIDETEKVLITVISAYINEKLDSSSFFESFEALLVHLAESDEQEELLPFAKVGIEVLENLGGEYADFAAKVREDIEQQTRPEPQKEESSTDTPPLPELKIFTFNVATIEIQETRTFEFSVATLERQPSSSVDEEVEWVINRQKQQGTAIIEVLEPDVSLELIEIPGGSFIMGAPEAELQSRDSERPQHKVTVPTFLMGRYPITQAQWRVVAGWEQVERKLDPDRSRFKEDYEGIDRWTRPVESISWEEAVEFCARLSKKTNKEYRLPTEAEWEYACRAVTSDQSSAKSEELTVEEWNEQYNQPFHFGETISTELANYDGNYTYGEGVKGEGREQTTPVGYFKVANNFGLSDMHGNVWEWCGDNWHENYEGAPNDGSAWLSEESNMQVARGGSWYTYPRVCRSAYRNGGTRGSRLSDVGFRVVCVVPRTT